MSSHTRPLETAQTDKSPALFVAYGVALWFAFLVFIRLVGESVFSHGNPALLVMFALTVPISYGLVWGVAKLTSTPLNRMLAPTVIMSFTALLIDGLVIGFTYWYGDSLAQVAAAGASLLWGVGAAQVIAWALSRR